MRRRFRGRDAQLTPPMAISIERLGRELTFNGSSTSGFSLPTFQCHFRSRSAPKDRIITRGVQEILGIKGLDADIVLKNYGGR
ncbi:hypothetical protein AVEN_40413-1 [Araneus ventricosus]|uniref:Uncharacterized protein n=1 Tax=Araneus ventricosus TaxID=182803 RepID=A0A4Y2DC79_ARAVE|nr:hypothetical protein AVEN_40413-1 [Araneus ventricosus]